jgi:hypothetical protein
MWRRWHPWKCLHLLLLLLLLLVICCLQGTLLLLVVIMLHGSSCWLPHDAPMDT